MKIDGNSPIPSLPLASAPERRAGTPEEAARQFEAVLVRQFVDTMTDGLFEESFSGEEGPGWMSSQRDVQRDALAEVLTEHLVESGVFRIADLMLRQWSRERPGATDEAPVSEKPLSLQERIAPAPNRETP